MAKLDRDLMDQLIFDKDLSDDKVVMGPEYGEDAAVIDIGDRYLVAHNDPISGAVENIGWLAINIAANDIAVSGAKPSWALLNIQFPADYSKDNIIQVMADIHEASDRLGIEIVGGHTETLEQIEKPLVTTTMMGETENPIYTRGSSPGDKIIQIGEAGLEGTWILASDFEQDLSDLGVDKETINKAKDIRSEISVVESALRVIEQYSITSMHDPTEGGLFQGLYEMAAASKNKFKINSELKIKDITKEICKKLNLDPLRLISSGCLIFTVPESVETEVGKVIGEVVEGDSSVVISDDEFDKPINEDELFKAIKEFTE